MFRGWLTAQEHGFPRKALFIESGLDVSGAHEGKKAFFVGIPAALALFISVEHFLRWREQGLMFISCAADLTQEVSQVRLLGEGGELRGVIQSYVEEALD